MGSFDSAAEVFIQVPGSYADWDAFAARFLEVTHTELDVDAERRAQIRAAFEAHMTPTGAHFLKPHRIDVLRKNA
ncbi:MAG: hypothetical protein WBM40_02720 [Thiohalocapsa sp.]